MVQCVRLVKRFPQAVETEVGEELITASKRLDGRAMWSNARFVTDLLIALKTGVDNFAG